jgi:hypothetical protein
LIFIPSHENGVRAERGNYPMSEAISIVTEKQSVRLDKRVELLAGVAAFGLVERVAALMREARYDEGSVIVSEEEAGDRIFLIAEGRAEAAAKGATGMVPLSLYGIGSLVYVLLMMGAITVVSYRLAVEQ